MKSISAQYSHLVSVDKTLTDCNDAFDMAEVQLAYRCLDKLLARPKAHGEDDAEMRNGARAILRLIAESLARRQDVAIDALRAMSAAVARDRVPRAK